MMIKIYKALLSICIATLPLLVNGQHIKRNLTIKDTLKTELLSEVEVLGKLKKMQKVTSLNIKQLSIVQAPTLGETLSRISGVQNISFGPNVGLPMIRSLSGSRVKLLSDDMGMTNLSGITPNVNIDFDQDKLVGIKLSKGSASVLYGGKAIGGAVNLKTNLIPSRLQSKNVEGRVILDLGSNSGSRQSFSINGNSGKKTSWHLGAMHHQNKEVKIPGNTKPSIAYDTLAIGFDTTLQLLTQMKVSSTHKLNRSLFPYISAYAKKYMKVHELSYNDIFTFKKESIIDGKKVINKQNPIYVAGQDRIKDRYTPIVKNIKDFGPVEKGKIPNSHSKGNSAEIGINYTTNNLVIGTGYQYSNSSYGIPGYALSEIILHSHTHGNGKVHKKTKIDFVPINSSNETHMGRTQIDMIDVIPVFEYIKFKGLLQNSINKELLAEKVANQFNSLRYSSRLELHQERLRFLKGITGIDYQYQKIIGKGTQRYLPNNKSSEWGFFTSQQLDYKFLNANIGYRHDIVRRTVLTDPTYKPGRGIAGGALSDKHFKLHQFSSMIKSDFWNIGYLSISYNHSERAPEVNELYTGNKHFAIMTEENGNDKIEKEIAKTFEMELGGRWKNLRLSFNYYNTYFNNYLYLGDTGISRDNFLVKEWRSANTEIYGYESQVSYTFDLETAGKWDVNAYFDLVKNKDLSGNKMRNHHQGTYMPNMPTSRYGFSLSGVFYNFTLNINLEHYMQQKYLGKHTNPEFAFPAYSLLNERLSYPLNLKFMDIECYIYGKNLLNSKCRPHNSLLRYLAPLPGINLGGGLKISI